MRLRTVIGIVAPLGFLGCGGGDRLTAIPDAHVLAGIGSNQVIASLSAWGCFDLSSAGLTPGCVDIEAMRHTGGTASGSFRMHRPGSGGIVDFEASVICFVVDAANSRAWVGARVTRNRSTDPAAMTPINEPGRDVWFRLVDYTGAGQPSRTTVLGFEGAAGFITSIDYCEGRPWPAEDARTFPFLSGRQRVTP